MPDLDQAIDDLRMASRRLGFRLVSLVKETVREKHLNGEVGSTFSDISGSVCLEMQGALGQLPPGIDADLHEICQAFAKLVQELDDRVRDFDPAESENDVRGWLAQVRDRCGAWLVDVIVIQDRLDARKYQSENRRRGPVRSKPVDTIKENEASD